MPGPAVRGWLRLLPWLLLLGGLGGGGWWRYYLAPRHLPYLWSGLAALALVLLLSELDSMLGRTRKRRTALLSAIRAGRGVASVSNPLRQASLADWLESCVHWLPLLLLVALGPTTLSLRGYAATPGQLASLEHRNPSAMTAVAPAAQIPLPRSEPVAPPAAKPVVEPPTGSAQTDNPAPVKPAGKSNPAIKHDATPAPASKPKPPAADVKAATIPKPAAPPVMYRQYDVLKLYTQQNLPAGAPVEVIGRLHLIHGADEVLPEGVDPHKAKVVLYRYVLWCCVVDAVPATAVLEGLPAAKVKDDAWVCLRGRLYRTGATHDIPLLKVDSVEPVKTPTNPYIFCKNIAGI